MKEIEIFGKYVVYGFFFISLLMTHGAFAVQNPRALATDSRIKVVTYQPDNVVRLCATTFITTQIIFGEDEVITDIQNGDLAAWTVSVLKGHNNILSLKPTILGSNTNMIVMTNQHTYYFHLMSNKNNTNNQRTSTYAIRFIYPEEARANALAKVLYRQAQKRTVLNKRNQLQHYNWDYSFNGTRSIMPLHILDDGQFTYLELRMGQPIPAIFAVNNVSGKEAVVNYRRDGDYLVIQEIAPQFTLRAGEYQVASVFNNKLIKQIKNQG